MENDQNYPSLVQQGKNLAKFSWDLIKYIQQNHNSVLVVSEEVYKERIMTCRGCDKYDELENRCRECGCYLPAKAKVILDSCPLGKWAEEDSNWEETFKDLVDKIESPNNNETDHETK